MRLIILLALVYVTVPSIGQVDTLKHGTGNQVLLDTISLKEIEVVGFRPDITTKSPNPIQIMTTKTLDAIPSGSVADAIRNFSGVVIKDYGGIGGLKTVMIRSMGANHTAVFIDGLPQTDASTGQTDLGRIPIQSIGNIELSTGQTAIELKPARMFASASLMSINTIEYDFKEEKSYLGLYLKGGSFGSVNPLVSFDSKANEHIIYGIRLNYYSSNGKYPYLYTNGATVDELKRTNSDIKSIDGAIRSTVTFKDSSTLKVKASWYQSERGLPGAVIFYNPHSSQRLYNNEVNTGLQYSNSYSKSIKGLITAGFSDSRLVYKDPDFLNQSGGLRNEYSQNEYYLSKALSFILDKDLTIGFSTDVIYNKLTTNAYSIKSPSRISSLTAASAIWKLKNTELQAGLLMTAIIDKPDEADGKNYFKLSPAFSAIRSLTSDHSLKVRFMYKSIYRMPTFNDLYYTISGNNQLSPENATLFDLGILLNKTLGNSTSISFRTDGFLNYVSDKIVTVPTRNLFIWSTRNIGTVTIKGFELYTGMTHKFNGIWAIDLSGTYTYQDARNTTTDDVNYGNQISYIPYETAGILGAVYFKLYSVGVNYLYNGFRYTTPSNDSNSILPSWNTLDLILSRKWIYESNKFDVKLELANILNENYEVVKGFPMTGRAIYISLFVQI
jgi:vitamin B12 transporter